MAKGPGKSLATIQRLLAERVQIEGWLERLSLAGDKTPEDVRDRIKSDYQTRLGELLKELANYGSELNDALKRQLITREGLVKQEKEAANRLSEAEVRHAVGEYDEARWREIHAEYLGTLVRIREELKNAEDDIQRLEDAVKSLNAKPAHGPAPMSTPVPPAPEPALPKRSEPIKQKDALDELAFLKSVTEDEKQGPAPARAAGVAKAPEAIRPPDDHRVTSPPDLQLPPPPPSPKTTVDVGAVGVAPIDTAGPGKRLTAQLDKSLKCKECGTMNLPTEWYCEKCGAELSESL